MRIWDHDFAEISRKVNFAQFSFLTTQDTELYLAILIELYKSRQGTIDIEIAFEDLFRQVEKTLAIAKPDLTFERMALRTHLNQLETWGNVLLRLEPKRIRRIQDRGLDRYLVRLTDSTTALLLQLEQQLRDSETAQSNSVEFNLADVDDFLAQVIEIANLVNPEADQLTKVGRLLSQTRNAVEQSSRELMRLDLWLSEMAINSPERERLTELLKSLSNYVDKYLGNIETQRIECSKKLDWLLDDERSAFFQNVFDAIAREFADDPTRLGVQPPNPFDVLRSVNDFLATDGILDTRRNAVHQRLADVTGHLKRFLAALVRRSQLVSGLQELSRSLFHVPSETISNGVVDQMFFNLWQSAHAVLDSGCGTPNEQLVPVRPFNTYIRRRERFSGSAIRPRSKNASNSRPALIKQLDDLNEFVNEFILRDQAEVHVSEIELAGWEQIKLFLMAVKCGRLGTSSLYRRHLRFRISIVDHPKGKTVMIPALDHTGSLTVPQMVFTKAR